MSVSRHIDRYIDPFDLVFSRSLLDDPLTSSLLSLHNRAMNDLTHAAGDKTSTVKRFSPLLSADVVESENDYHVHVDLPGVNKEDLDISFNDGLMTITAERKEVMESNSVFHKVHKVERNFGKVQRSIALPKNADAEHAQASMKDGVLMISFPKIAESPKAKKIPIA
jgi:HSP20 family protein